MSLARVPTKYASGWFDFDHAVPCWIRFATKKPTRITLMRQEKDFKAAVKPGARYAARLLLVNDERTFASIEFPELGGIGDGVDLAFAVPEFLPEIIETTAQLADAATLLNHWWPQLSPLRVSVKGQTLTLKK